MNYALLWIDMLVAGLLWAAFATACLGRLRRRWVRNTLWCILAPIPLILPGLLVCGMGVAKFEAGFEPNWFSYFLSLFLVCAAGEAVIAWRGSRREPGFSVPMAGAWPRGMMGCAFLGAVAIGYITLSNMDAALRARCAIMSIDLNSTYRALAPAIVSESQNAAPLYEQAFAQLKSDTGMQDVNNAPLGNANHFNPAEPGTVQLLARQHETIQLLRKAAAMPACRFDQDMERPDLNALMPVFSAQRLSANMLWLDAREEQALGHDTVAIEDVAAIYRWPGNSCPGR